MITLENLIDQWFEEKQINGLQKLSIKYYGTSGEVAWCQPHATYALCGFYKGEFWVATSPQTYCVLNPADPRFFMVFEKRLNEINYLRGEDKYAKTSNCD